MTYAVLHICFQMLQVDAPRITVPSPSLPPQPSSQWEMNQSSQVLLQRFRHFCDWAARAFLSLKSKMQAWGLPLNPQPITAHHSYTTANDHSFNPLWTTSLVHMWADQTAATVSTLICSHRHIEATVQTRERHLSATVVCVRTTATHHCQQPASDHLRKFIKISLSLLALYLFFKSAYSLFMYLFIYWAVI